MGDGKWRIVSIHFYLSFFFLTKRGIWEFYLTVPMGVWYKCEHNLLSILWQERDCKLLVFEADSQGRSIGDVFLTYISYAIIEHNSFLFINTFGRQISIKV